MNTRRIVLIYMLMKYYRQINARVNVCCRRVPIGLVQEVILAAVYLWEEAMSSLPVTAEDPGE